MNNEKVAYEEQPLANLDPRQEANTLKARYYEAVDAGKPTEITYPLHVSMMEAVGRAAQIEREKRLEL